MQSNVWYVAVCCGMVIEEKQLTPLGLFRPESMRYPFLWLKCILENVDLNRPALASDSVSLGSKRAILYDVPHQTVFSGL